MFFHILVNLLCIGHQMLDVGTVLKCVLYTHWRELIFSVSCYRLEIASRLGKGACVCFLITVQGQHLSWTYAGPMHAVTVSGILYLTSVPFIWMTVSVMSSCDSYNLSVLFSMEHPESWWEQFVDIALMREYSKVSHCLHQLWVSLCIPIYCRGILTYWSMSIAEVISNSFAIFIYQNNSI